ncbi:MAG: WecB/TagA/CpsF family glycosyltransferase [Candidatus Dormibacteraeota bacterium]|nr:WecB/TagA/CpsF family glycosyltransferase [Candidatus Dormibacteraeota bacterium]
MDSVRVLGVRVDRVNLASAVAEIERLVDRSDGPQLVATVNPEFVMRAGADPLFRRVLDGAALAIPDGIGVVWAMRRQGARAQTRVTGADLVPALAQLCVRRSWRLFLLGAQPGVAAAAAARLQQTMPGLSIAGTHAGSPGPEGDEESLRRIAAAGPDLLLVAYGHPRQELWVERNRARIQVPVAVGVGGAFDFIAGRVRRAPLAVQRLHVEWLWRLGAEPWRARRMAVLPVYAAQVLLHRERV